MANLRYVCDAAGDLELLVRERDYDEGVGEDGKAPLRKTATIKVSRACVQRYTSLLDVEAANHGKWEGGGRLVIDDESIAAVRVWMGALHRREPRDGWGEIDISDVWWAIHFGNKYREWFSELLYISCLPICLSIYLSPSAFCPFYLAHACLGYD